MAADWTTSSYCTSGKCVETRADEDTVQVRDARRGPIVIVPTEAWREFVASLAKRDDHD